MLAMPGGERRLANVRKLMRLGARVRGRGRSRPARLPRARRADATAGWASAGDARESEAPVEGEALDAVRLMTIHRAKGLEFEIVCVADLGRGPRLVRRPAARRPRRPLRSAAGRARDRAAATRALDYEALGEEQPAAEEQRGAAAVLRRDDAGPGAADPERRGEARRLGQGGTGGGPIGWIAPAFVPDIAAR